MSAGCATPGPVSPIRFANRDPVWKVNDRLDTRRPASQGFPRLLYYFDQVAFRRLTRLMDVPEPRHAANVNSLDEVPDSTWFTNRIGTGKLTAAEVRRGPNVDDGPDRSAPWVIQGTKVGGVTVGFVIKDARGVKYVLKFDREGVPETETGANVVVQRLMWAAGFHVPEDTVVRVTRDMLVLADDAEVADTFGNKRPMTRKDLDDALARVNVYPDGSFRGMASKFLAGEPLGGVEPEGVREDDRNDLVPHEERREMRGQYVIFSWVDHTDVKFDNFLDMWIADPADPQRHYVVHYLVDFGNALGTMGVVDHREDDGFAYQVDFEYMLSSLVTFGLWRRPWEGARVPALTGVGRVEADRFEPDNWRTAAPWTPFHRRDRFDGFWGAKIVAAFTPEMIWAAVEAGTYSDPRAARYLWRTLMARREKIVRYWFKRVTPIDRVAVEGGALCFTDLAITHGLARPARARYRIAAYGGDGQPLAWRAEVRPDAQGRACAAGVPAGPGRDGYLIARIVPSRPGAAMRPVEAHLAVNPAGRLRVIGLHRW
ncbi:MAG TPA: hypothetical protein VFU21_16895 [Kofleriaceae bacterium]|nr:hypothetical protein [Kofleriaceae bacterium]